MSKEKAFVLIVDSDESASASLSDKLRAAGHVCKVVHTDDEAVSSVSQRPPDVVVAVHHPDDGIDGMSILQSTKSRSPETEVVVISSTDSGEEARTALSPVSEHRAYDYLTESSDVKAITRAVDGAAEKALTQRHDRLMRERLGEAFDFEGMIGTSEVLAREIRRITKIAPTKSPVLVVGETGTGKELVASAIHRHSDRAGKPFQVVNVAALSDTLAESELFGHIKGAFTGALGDRKGLVESADGGTLFLDEIGDMSLGLQAKILRTLENGEVMRVGSNEVRHVDVRFVAATHHDLSELVEKGRFREDLFYRLHAHGAIRLPPLRNRREDIPLLIRHFVELANAEYGRSINGISPEALRKMTNHTWRGNVRELRNVIERLVIEADGDLLEVEDLPENISGSTDIVPVGLPSLTGLSMADVERIHILNTLKLTGGNREKAAAILKIGERTLYRKLKDYGIT